MADGILGVPRGIYIVRLSIWMRQLILTPPTEQNQQWARTLEALMPLDYAELQQWSENRRDDYEAYSNQKREYSERLIKLIRKIYPDIDNCIADSFSATSLTWRDDYLSPEGAMFGLAEPIGAATTRVKGLYMGGQNIFLHGVCGTAMTAQMTVEAMLQA